MVRGSRLLGSNGRALELIHSRHSRKPSCGARRGRCRALPPAVTSLHTYASDHGRSRGNSRPPATPCCGVHFGLFVTQTGHVTRLPRFVAIRPLPRIRYWLRSQLLLSTAPPPHWPRRRLPTLYSSQGFAAGGGLLSYGTNYPAAYAQVGTSAAGHKARAGHEFEDCKGARPHGAPVHYSRALIR